jgi:myo-inositol-1(or 4)-monophosphatase
VWIVDPIDGTRAFAQGGDEWCVAAALLVEGRPALSAIYRPMTEDLYEARHGEGARLNGKPLHMADARGLAGARILGNASALKQLEAKARVKAVGGGNTPLAMRLARVAQGDLEAALSTAPKHDWDLAAGDLLVHEAGGKVTGLDGKRFTYNRRETRQANYVASSHALHAALLEQLAAS